MRKIHFTALFLLMTVMAAPAFAAEQTAREVMPVMAEGRASAEPLTVTGSGQLTVKPGTVFTEGGNYEGIELPYLISTPRPIQYPRWALRQGWEGRFSIAIEVLPDGTVGRYKVMQSTGHSILDKAATEAVKTWKFHPAFKNGKAIPECVQIPVNFEIQEK